MSARIGGESHGNLKLETAPICRSLKTEQSKVHLSLLSVSRSTSSRPNLVKLEANSHECNAIDVGCCCRLLLPLVMAAVTLLLPAVTRKISTVTMKQLFTLPCKLLTTLAYDCWCPSALSYEGNAGTDHKKTFLPP